MAEKSYPKKNRGGAEIAAPVLETITTGQPVPAVPDIAAAPLG